MGLAVYTSTSTDDKVDDNHPISFTFDGRVGGIQEKCVYLRNDDLLSWYGGITASLVDTDPTPVSHINSTHFEWRLLEKDRVTIPEDWENISAGNTISISSDLGSSSQGDISTFIPIWIRIKLSPGLPIQRIVSVVIRLGYTRYLI